MPNAVQISGRTLTVTLESPLKSNTKYHVKVDAGAVLDLAGNPWPGIDDETTWTFTTEDVEAPAVQTFSPANDATGAGVSGPLSLEFGEDVKAGTGSVTISDGAGDTRTIAVS